YFDQVMREQFLPSARVQFLPMSNYLGDGQIESLFSGEITTLSVGKIVDATYMNVTVPSMRSPPFEVDASVSCVPLNELPKKAVHGSGFVVVGAGKTGFDACLFLLNHGVDPDRITWIMPRDAWLLDRASIQALDLFEAGVLTWFSDTFEAIAAADSVADMFLKIEACGQLMRFDPTITPSMYRCCTVTRAELEELRRIGNVVRQGRVRRIESDRVVLDDGELSFAPDTLFIDCTADGLERRAARPVFDDGRITLQAVRTCQQVFSAAFIGHVEAAYADEAIKNELCVPVPHPDTDIDFMTNVLADLANAARWSEDEALVEWMINSRLDGFSQPGDPTAAELALREKIAQNGGVVAEKLQQFLSDTAERPAN
ncbi:MAG: NAD(P)/FAD-dependent oxidoreductase, partial [Pseudomonadota bacterium]